MVASARICFLQNLQLRTNASSQHTYMTPPAIMIAIMASAVVLPVMFKPLVRG